MSCIAWNCCGLRNLHTTRELVKIIRAKDPSIVFLVETMVDDVGLEIVQSKIGFDHHWVVLREGRGGGLVIFWKATINLTIEESNKSYIDAFIDKNLENEWRLTGFYGKLEIATLQKRLLFAMKLFRRLQKAIVKTSFFNGKSLPSTMTHQISTHL